LYSPPDDAPTRRNPHSMRLTLTSLQFESN
jgi:hypothetical protein